MLAEVPHGGSDGRNDAFSAVSEEDLEASALVGTQQWLGFMVGINGY